MKHLLLALAAFLLLTSYANAQTIPAQPTQIGYDLAPLPGEALLDTLHRVNLWQPVLYVNSQKAAMITKWDCAAVTFVTCTFIIPDITPLVTPSGLQIFEVALRDAIFGEGPKSSPLALSRPSAPTKIHIP